MLPIIDPDMKPERSELAKQDRGFVLNVNLGGLPDMVQIVNFIQWALPKNGYKVESLHFEDNLLEVHCVQAADPEDA